MISRLYIRIVHASAARIVMKQTKIPFSEFGWIRRDRELLAVALVFGMTLAPLETIKATDAPARPQRQTIDSKKVSLNRILIFEMYLPGLDC
jgi:hypothetical protein